MRGLGPMSPVDSILLQRESGLEGPVLVALYRVLGWTNYSEDPEGLERAFANSSHVVAAWSGDLLVGLARCVSDDVSIAYLQDILVLPDYQGRGIGKALLTDCLERYSHVRQKVLLTDDRPEQIAFYKKLGFHNTRDLECTPLNVFVIIEGASLS